MNARELLLRETGMSLGALVVERAVAERMAARTVHCVDSYLGTIDRAELQRLIELVVVPESWMFRDPEAFGATVRYARERLAASPQRVLRILSIPCAGGEEPYSIAMALHDAGVARSAIVIDAIDLSLAALERARRGRYTRNAFRGADLAFRERHFTEDGVDYQISDSLREQVNFAQGNLMTIDALASGGRYDVIFCRNLLIYFDDASTASAIARLRLMLADDGVLFAGYSEVPTFCNHGFTPLRAPGAFALHKECREERREERRLAAVPGTALVRPAPPAQARSKATPAPPVPSAPSVPPVPPAPPAPQAMPPERGEVLARASRLADLGDYAGASTLCHELLKTHPDCADAYFILGMISECERKPGAADGYWRRCVYLQPDHYEALCHLALLAETSGDLAQATIFKQRAARVYARRDDAVARKPVP